MFFIDVHVDVDFVAAKALHFSWLGRKSEKLLVKFCDHFAQQVFLFRYIQLRLNNKKTHRSTACLICCVLFEIYLYCLIQQLFPLTISFPFY